MNEVFVYYDYCGPIEISQLIEFEGIDSFFSFCRCILDEKYQQAMGMAVECRRLDKLEETIVRSDNVHSALAYCINLSHTFVNHREYRSEVCILPFRSAFHESNVK